MLSYFSIREPFFYTPCGDDWQMTTYTEEWVLKIDKLWSFVNLMTHKTLQVVRCGAAALWHFSLCIFLNWISQLVMLAWGTPKPQCAACHWWWLVVVGGSSHELSWGLCKPFTAPHRNGKQKLKTGYRLTHDTRPTARNLGTDYKISTGFV